MDDVREQLLETHNFWAESGELLGTAFLVGVTFKDGPTRFRVEGDMKGRTFTDRKEALAYINAQALLYEMQGAVL